MNRLYAVMLTGVALAGISCTPSSPAGQGAGSKPGMALAVPAGGEIPAGAQWTIECGLFSGPDHVMQATATRDQLQATAGKTGLNQWHIVHTDAGSALQYGYYQATDESVDKKEARRAREDQRKIKELIDPGSGDHVFKMVKFIPLESVDPAAPPQYDLRNSPGYWTLQVGAYKDSPDRKQAAVNAVLEARKAGIEAYYYHGPTVSSVCIGSWPADAVKRQDAAVAHTDSPDVVPLVTNIPLTPRKGLETDDHHPIRVMQPKLEVIDASMKAAMVKYPSHSTNGEEGREVRDPKSGKVTREIAPSFVVVIPHDRGAAGGSPANGGIGAPGNSPPPGSDMGGGNASPTPAKGSHLRSIGE